MNARAVFTLVGAALALGACGPRSAGVCLEMVCFDVPLDTPIAHAGGRHTIRPAEGGGWINVQRFVPIEPPPSEPEALARALGERHRLSASFSVLSVSTTRLLDTTVAVNDLAIETARGRLRRRTWVVPADDRHPWLCLDVTAPESSFTAALSSLQPVIERARRAP
jgi:hypothetical protein